MLSVFTCYLVHTLAPLIFGSGSIVYSTGLYKKNKIYAILVKKTLESPEVKKSATDQLWARVK